MMKVTKGNKVIIYFDMDGVLAKWNEFASVEETQVPGYFLAREPEPHAIVLVRFLKKIGLDVRILSAVYPNGFAEKEKKAWLESHDLSDIPVVFVPYGADKYSYIDKSVLSDGMAILIDDFKKNLLEWRGHGGIAIKFYNGINDRPHIIFAEDKTARLVQDSWVGLSIDHRESPAQMAALIIGVIEMGKSYITGEEELVDE